MVRNGLGEQEGEKNNQFAGRWSMGGRTGPELMTGMEESDTTRDDFC